MKQDHYFELSKLNPQTDHCTMMPLIFNDGFNWDIERSLEIALFRAFASPSVSKLLNKTKQFKNDGQKRYDDTSLLIMSMMYEGYDSEFGQRALHRMNQSHSHFVISNEDFLFVLTTFILDPIDWIEQFGWRKLIGIEKEAIFWFWYNIAKLMGLKDIPTSLTDMRTYSDNYIAHTFRQTEDTVAVADATVQIAKNWLPKQLHFAVRPSLATFFDDQTLTALGLKKPPVYIKALVRQSLKARALAMKTTRFEARPIGSRTYPDGFNIDRLAPSALLKAEERAK